MSGGIELKGGSAKVKMLLEITRADTGKKETVEVEGYLVPEQSPASPQSKEQGDGAHA